MERALRAGRCAWWHLGGRDLGAASGPGSGARSDVRARIAEFRSRELTSWTEALQGRPDRIAEADRPQVEALRAEIARRLD